MVCSASFRKFWKLDKKLEEETGFKNSTANKQTKKTPPMLKIFTYSDGDVNMWTENPDYR